MLAEGQSTPVNMFSRDTKKAAMKPDLATSLYHIRVDKKSKWNKRAARLMASGLATLQVPLPSPAG
jgi:hypothetical protein